MPTTPAPKAAPKLPERVRNWRRETLEAAGYPPHAAIALSEDPDVDVHEAVRLLRDGCPVWTALRILL